MLKLIELFTQNLYFRVSISLWGLNMTETVAKYTIKIKNDREQAEKILEQIDELMIWFENLFPSMQVEI